MQELTQCHLKELNQQSCPCRMSDLFVLTIGWNVLMGLNKLASLKDVKVEAECSNVKFIYA